MKKYAILAIAALVFAGNAFAAKYTIDPTHTQVEFTYSHFGFSNITGRFDQVSGEFDLNTKDLAKSKIAVEIPISSMSTGVDKLDIENESDLKRVVLSNEIEFADARETGARIAEMKVLEHEINKLKTERLAKFQGELQQATHDGVDLKLIDERRRIVERNTESLDRSHQLALRGLERDYDRETRELQRDERRDDRDYDREGRVLQRNEDRGNRLEDR